MDLLAEALHSRILKFESTREHWGTTRHVVADRPFRKSSSESCKHVKPCGELINIFSFFFCVEYRGLGIRIRSNFPLRNTKKRVRHGAVILK